MKQTIAKVLLSVSIMVMGAENVSAQGVLGNILGTVKDAVTSKTSSSSSQSSSSSTSASNILSGLTSIFSSSKVATADKLAGTWIYEEPAIVFESSNILKQAGGTIVSSSIEKKLQKTLDKYGIKKGKMKMTFDKDGNFTQTVMKKTVSGTYTVDGKNVKLTYTGGVSQIIGTTQLDGNSLLIVMDASKLLKFASVLGTASGNSTLGTVSSLLGSLDGMECGVRLKKN